MWLTSSSWFILMLNAYTGQLIDILLCVLYVTIETLLDFAFVVAGQVFQSIHDNNSYCKTNSVI